MSFDLLTAYRLATPSRREVQLVNNTAGILVAHGMRIPQCTVSWFDVADDGLPFGFAWRGSPVRIELRHGLAPRLLAEAAIHELWHSVDVSDPRCRHLGITELEARAYRVQASWGPVVWQALRL